MNYFPVYGVLYFPFFFFFLMHAFQLLRDRMYYLCIVNESQQPLYSEKKILKIGHTVLFTHLKSILFSVFSFQFSVFSKISFIQIYTPISHAKKKCEP